MDEESPRPSRAAVDDMLVQFGAIARQIARGDELMREGRGLKESGEADFEKLRAYAEMRGVDLTAELRARQEEQFGKLDFNDAPPIADFMRRFTVREFILEQAEAAYPEAVRAAELRRQFQQVTGQVVHEKTFGMTLYRLSQEDIPPVQRIGHADWFFIPERDRRPRTLGRGLSALLGMPVRTEPPEIDTFDNEEDGSDGSVHL